MSKRELLDVLFTERPTGEIGVFQINFPVQRYSAADAPEMPAIFEVRIGDRVLHLDQAYCTTAGVARDHLATICRAVAMRMLPYVMNYLACDDIEYDQRNDWLPISQRTTDPSDIEDYGGLDDLDDDVPFPN
jgi:hypothetical protein